MSNSSCPISAISTPASGMTMLGGGYFPVNHSTRLLDSSSSSGQVNGANSFNSVGPPTLQFSNSSQWTIISGNRLSFPSPGVFYVNVVFQFSAPGGSTYGTGEYVDFSLEDDVGATWFKDRTYLSGTPATNLNSRNLSGEVVITTANQNKCFFGIKTGTNVSSNNTITLYIKGGSIRRIL